MIPTIHTPRHRVLAHSILISVFGSALAAQERSSGGNVNVPAFVTSNRAPTMDRWATFSPDGKSIVFSRAQRRRGKNVLMIVSAAGGEVRPLAESPLPVSATRASWSKTGRIAFSGATGNGHSQLWLIDADGKNSEFVNIKGLPRRTVYPSWYADGQRLVVLDSAARMLRLVDLKKNTISSLTRPGEVLAGMPSVSPTGKWIAFAGQANSGTRYNQAQNSIFLVNEKLKVRRAESAANLGRNPAWSPDGNSIAFRSNRGSANGRAGAIFVMDTKGKNVRRLTPYSWNASHPIYSPDGRKIVFTARHPRKRGVSGVAVLDLPKNVKPASSDPRSEVEHGGKAHGRTGTLRLDVHFHAQVGFGVGKSLVFHEARRLVNEEIEGLLKHIPKSNALVPLIEARGDFLRKFVSNALRFSSVRP